MIILVPAYSRIYTKKNDMLKDWKSGKDFKIMAGPYCSIRDKESMLKDFRTIEIRYGNNKELSHFIED